MLKQLLDFPIFRLDLPIEEKVETMDKLASIEAQNIVETTVRFSN